MTIILIILSIFFCESVNNYNYNCINYIYFQYLFIILKTAKFCNFDHVHNLKTLNKVLSVIIYNIICVCVYIYIYILMLVFVK